MSRTRKTYNTMYKKNSGADRDSYLSRRSPDGILSCRGCGAIYALGRWALEPAEDIRRRAETDARLVECPACRKIRDHYALGIVEISGIGAADKKEILRLLKNEETRARAKNPLARILAVVNDVRGMRIETTTEKLAQRLGRSLNKARGGKVTYKWSHRNKFARVLWESRQADRSKAREHESALRRP